MNAESQLQELHARYQGSLPNKRASVELAWRALCENSSDPARLESLMRLVHRLAGSAPSYGYLEIGELAGNADALLGQACDADAGTSGASGSSSILDGLAPLIGSLLQALDDASSSPVRRHAMH